MILRKIFSYLQFKKVINIKQVDKINTNNFKVCFFPHKGPIGINYKKNYFYSKDKNDFFYFSSILHFEWSQADIKDSTETLHFYKQNKIVRSPNLLLKLSLTIKSFDNEGIINLKRDLRSGFDIRFNCAVRIF